MQYIREFSKQSVNSRTKQKRLVVNKEKKSVFLSIGLPVCG